MQRRAQDQPKAAIWNNCLKRLTAAVSNDQDDIKSLKPKQVMAPTAVPSEENCQQSFTSIPTLLDAILNVFCWHCSGCVTCFTCSLSAFSSASVCIIFPGNPSQIHRNQADSLYWRGKIRIAGRATFDMLTSVWLQKQTAAVCRVHMQYNHTVKFYEAFYNTPMQHGCTMKVQPRYYKKKTLSEIQLSKIWGEK